MPTTPSLSTPRQKTLGSFPDTLNQSTEGPIEDEQYNFWKLARRFYLSYDMVMEAKQVFDKYREMELNLASRPVSGAFGVNYPVAHQGVEEANKCCEGPSASSGTESQLPSENSTQAHDPASCHRLNSTSTNLVQSPSTVTKEKEELGVVGLQAFYLDLGIPKSALEIADVIQLMRSYPAELAMLKRKELAERELEVQRKREQELMEQGMLDSTGRSSRVGKKGKKNTSKNTSPPSPSSLAETMDNMDDPEGTSVEPASYAEAAAVEASQAKGLTFPLFLFLLQNRLSEEEGTPAHKDEEVIQAFHSLDADHDGMLSEEDIQRSLIYLLEEEGVLHNDRDLIELAQMHPVELRSAILECDMNADGLVTVEDLLAVLRV